MHHWIDKGSCQALSNPGVRIALARGGVETMTLAGVIVGGTAEDDDGD